jgi:hypothetical protein
LLNCLCRLQVEAKKLNGHAEESSSEASENDDGGDDVSSDDDDDEAKSGFKNSHRPRDESPNSKKVSFIKLYQ